MNDFKPHALETAPEGAHEDLRAVEKRLGFIPNMMAVLEVIVAAAFKLISNYTNHIADIPLDEVFQSFVWKKAG